MKFSTGVITILHVLWSHVDDVNGACNADEHHPENNGYFIEGINGFGSILDPTSDSKRKITNSTWQAGIEYPDGSLKFCEGMFCSEKCKNEGCPDIIYGHTCSMIRFCYDSGSGSDVWMMPDEMAMAKCDFSGAKQICNETDGEGDECCNYYVEEDADLKLYLFASKAGCDAGQKAAVEIADFADVGDACYGMGLTTSRIRQCTCNYEDRESSTLSEPCHSQFVAGCNYHSPELGEDKSCCETGTCVGKHLDYEDPIGKAIEDDRKKLCRDDIPGRCLNSIEDTDDCCTKTCKSCGTDANPFLEWAACDKGNATTSIGECGYGGHGGRFSKYECDFSKCEDGHVWAVTGDLYKDWIKTVDKDNYHKGLTMLEAVSELNLTILGSAVAAAGLVDTLSGPGPFTLFAPTNEALEALGNIENIPTDTVKQVLLDHVVAGKFTSSDVMQTKEFTTVGGKTITFTETEEGAKINDARISDNYDIEVSNGVIHVMSDVITFELPSGACYDMSAHVCSCQADVCSKELCEAKERIWTDQCPSHCDAEVCAQGGQTKNILEVAESLGIFTTLLSAVKSSGLEETLSGPGPFTLIAPTDEAFEAYGDVGTSDEVKTLLTNHVISGRYTSENVSNGMEFTTLGGKVMKLKVDEEASSASINGADIVMESMDIEASNGIITAVSKVVTFEDEEESESSEESEASEEEGEKEDKEEEKEKEEDEEEEKDDSDKTSDSLAKYMNRSVTGFLFLVCTLL